MELPHVPIFTIVFLALIASHAAVEPQVYFKSMLPKSRMPKAIKDLMSNEVGSSRAGASMSTNTSSNFPLYGDAASNEQLKDSKLASLFILEEGIHKGQNVNLYIINDASLATTFIPRRISDSLPFTSNKLLNIYEAFSVKPDSVEAQLIKKTINECESPAIQGEEKYCATSLESMVDFISLKLGKNVKAVSTEVYAKESNKIQEYKIEGVKKLATDTAVVCHKQYYLYAVFNCHKTPNTNAYIVSLVGADSTRANAIAVCHEDTTSWNPKHLALKVLNVKPGSASVCHFLTEGDVAWIPK